jgi:peptidoglycan hydrolase-like protein with peptidoglycan-binding domain
MKTKMLALGFALVLLLPPQVLDAFAQEAFKRNVVITGYYSPLPDQPYYVTGSYSGDIRLNGRGTNGADGTPVYPGMIAAPKDYAFGTKIEIPGIGIGTVHDRGGAIISNYKDKNTCSGTDCERVDRLDLWMGHGMEGLARALYYIGVKRAVATVYPGGSTLVADNMYFPSLDVATLFKSKINNYKPVQVASAGVSDSNNQLEYQKMLTLLGFYNGPVDGETSIKDSVYRFQKKHGLVASVGEPAAGYVGPQTSAELNKAVKEFYATVQSRVPQNNLGRGSNGSDVSKLQQALTDLGYYHGSINGTYDNKTIEAMFEFQKANDLMKDENDSAAGYYGTKTREVLKSALESKQQFERLSVLNQEIPPTDEPADDSSAAKDFIETHLSKNDSGEDVTKLQEYLRDLGYLDHAPTGYFGQLTEEAVLKFQKDNNIVLKDTEVGAGQFGTATRAKLATMVQKTTAPKVDRKIKASKIVGTAKKSSPSQGATVKASDAKQI